MGELSALEKRRLANIQRNESVLGALAIPALPLASPRLAAAGARPARRREPAETQPARRSTRLAAAATGGGLADELAFYRQIENRPEPKARAPRKERAPRPSAVPGGNFAPDVEVPYSKDEQPLPEDWAEMMRGAGLGGGDESASIGSARRRQKEVNTDEGACAAVAKVESAPLTIARESHVRKVAQDRIYCVAMHPGPARVVVSAGTKYGHLVLWDASPVLDGSGPGSVAHVSLHRDESLCAMRFAAGGSLLYTAGYDNHVRAVDLGGLRTYGTAVYCHDKARDKDGNAMGKWICAMDLSESLVLLTDADGFLVGVDPRAGRSPVLTGRLHDRKAGGLAVCPFVPSLFATSSLDGSVCLWDMRRLDEPKTRLEYGRAVTSVAWDPHCAAGRLASTCYDDHVRLHTGMLEDDVSTVSVAHNNQTGRWITPFRAAWDPKSVSGGSRLFLGNMDRGLDVVSADGCVQSYYAPELLTSQPAANAAHCARDVVASGTASGRLVLWTPTSS